MQLHARNAGDHLSLMPQASAMPASIVRVLVLCDPACWHLTALTLSPKGDTNASVIDEVLWYLWAITTYQDKTPKLRGKTQH